MVDEDSRLHAISASAGELRWEQSDLLYRQLSAPTVHNGFIMVADDKGFIHALSQVDGAIVGRTRLDRSGVRVRMLSVNGLLYAYSNKGNLIAYRLQAIDS